MSDIMTIKVTSLEPIRSMETGGGADAALGKPRFDCGVFEARGAAMAL